MVDRWQQLALEIAESVLMRVPAAQVHLHHANARLNQSPSDEKAMAPFLAAVAIAHGRRLLAQIEGVVLARPGCGQQLHRLLSARVPRRELPMSVACFRVALDGLKTLQQSLA